MLSAATTSAPFSLCPHLQGSKNYPIWVRHIHTLLIKDTLPEANANVFELATGNQPVIALVTNPNTIDLSTQEQSTGELNMNNVKDFHLMCTKERSWSFNGKVSSNPFTNLFLMDKPFIPLGFRA
ncbi:hypothetical protein P691DRAFT_769327 [Macrolepiota fuliginosa MF-IS2]|uniref:Uncharacterized protein n=1 Tax=Macrolepiota fuliginosa MF-IS2 TaxID=1400762 RepID=A0A9P5WW02_9AGAR|nr:hypothetical protein P691DRAFT_769327 [Macrolepiota fuliginosa MF-IS2]